MKSVERFLAALEGNIPDQVPLFELYVHPKIIEALDPGASWPDFVENWGLDAISSIWFFEDIFGQDWISEDTYRDEWGVTWKELPESRAPIDSPIRSLEDAKHYSPPDPYADIRLGKLPEYVERFKGEKAIVWGQRADFMWAADLVGMDKFLMAFLEDPALVHRVLDIVSEFSITLARRAIRAGADVVMLLDDVAFNSGPLISPALFEEFIMPRFSKAVKAVKEEGALCIKHSDGNLWKVLDMIVASGIDGIHPLDPGSGMDIKKTKRAYGDKVCLIGNIDCGSLLSNGTKDEVQATVKQTIKDAAPGGRYILSSSNSIHSSVKPENYRAMLESAKEWGGYPIEL
mgnify:CR=1 FL=1